MAGLEDRIGRLRQRIQGACDRAGRPVASVELLPVSKRQGPEAVRAALALGFRRFGENYVQEGAAKAEALPGAEFLLIGPLQRNKAKAALEGFGEILTLDRPALAERLRRLAEELGLTRPVWIQVDLWDEATKAGGCGEDALVDLVGALGRIPACPSRASWPSRPPRRRRPSPTSPACGSDGRTGSATASA